MNDLKTKLEKECEVNEDLKELVIRYDIPTNCSIRPYGLLGIMINKNATHDDLATLHHNIYFMNSLLNNENHWL